LLTFYEIPGTGLSTANAEIAEGHKQSGYRILECTVPVVTLDAILERYAERDVHWLKIDVEGLERDVLASWTLTAPLPWIVLVESTAPLTTTDTSAQWEPLLIAKGYQHVYFDGLNRFYVAPGHEKLCDAFKAPPNVFDDFALTRNSTFAQKLSSDIFNLEHRVAEQGEIANVQHVRASQLEKRLIEVSGQVERVSADLVCEQERNVTLVSQLMERQTQYETLATQFLEVQTQYDNRVVELFSMQRQVAEMTSELTAAMASIVHLRDALTSATAKADLASQEHASMRVLYDSILNSRSWRLTAPLRHVAQVMRSSIRTVRLAVAWTAHRLHRAARAVLLHGLVHVRAHPRSRLWLSRVLGRWHSLDVRLRSFAARHSGETVERSVRPRPEHPVLPYEMTADTRNLARRLEYVAELEAQLDEQEHLHRREIERLVREIETMRIDNVAGKSFPAKDSVPQHER
jgi:hypothetical protein